jgi:hypothetical protein
MIKPKVLLASLLILFFANCHASIFSEGWRSMNNGLYCKENNLTQLLSNQLDYAESFNKIMTKIRALQVSKPDSCSNSDPTKKDHDRKCNLIYGGCYDMPGLVSQLVEINEDTAKFFDQKLSKKIDELAALLYKNLDYCAKDFPADSTLKTIQNKINIDINQYINNNKQKIGL